VRAGRLRQVHITGSGDNMTITLGPLLFNWSDEKFLDFYSMVANELEVSEVYIGEVVCSKRLQLYSKHLDGVIETLKRCGKNVIFSSLSLINSEAEKKQQLKIISNHDFDAIELNDLSLMQFVNKEHCRIGPYINIYNPSALNFFINKGFNGFTLPIELSEATILELLRAKKTNFEIQVFGKMPLAISARCYHARSYGLTKDSCEFICIKDRGGLLSKTLDGEKYLIINGTQTMSSTCLNMIREIDILYNLGFSRFRVSPQSENILQVVKIFNESQQNKFDKSEAYEKLTRLMPNENFSNGFFYGQEGHKYFYT